MPKKSKAMTVSGPWRNRIVGEGEEAPDQLLANPENWRIHPKSQQDSLAGILDNIGWVQRVIVNRTTQHVIDGHLRVSMAISRGEKTVPVLYVDLSQEEENLILAVLDPITGMAVSDSSKLEELLQSVSSSDNAIKKLLADIANQNGIIFDKDGIDALDKQFAKLEDTEDTQIVIVVPTKYKDEILEWLSNGEKRTGPGMGQGVMKRCGLL
jgi:hypothetical protein